MFNMGRSQKVSGSAASQATRPPCVSASLSCEGVPSAPGRVHLRLSETVRDGCRETRSVLPVPLGGMWALDMI